MPFLPSVIDAELSTRLCNLEAQVKEIRDHLGLTDPPRDWLGDGGRWVPTPPTMPARKWWRW